MLSSHYLTALDSAILRKLERFRDSLPVSLKMGFTQARVRYYICIYIHVSMNRCIRT